MDKAGGQEGAGQGRGASGCRAGPGCIRCAKEGGGVCSLVSGWRAGSRGRQWGTPGPIGSGPGVKVELGGTRMDLETA